eukprot:944277-Amphidinium_carterae.1
MGFAESRAKLRALRQSAFYKSISAEVRGLVAAVGEALHEIEAGSCPEMCGASNGVQAEIAESGVHPHGLCTSTPTRTCRKLCLDSKSMRYMQLTLADMKPFENFNAYLTKDQQTALNKKGQEPDGDSGCRNETITEATPHHIQAQVVRSRISNIIIEGNIQMLCTLRCWGVGAYIV